MRITKATITPETRATLADLFRASDAYSIGNWMYSVQHGPEREVFLADPDLANALADYCADSADNQAAGGPDYYESAANYVQQAKWWRAKAVAAGVTEQSDCQDPADLNPELAGGGEDRSYLEVRHENGSHR